MTTITTDTPVSKPARWVGRVLSGFVIVFLLLDGAIKLVPWPVVTETMDRMGYGSSETLARSLGLITIVCTVLYSIPPTSILGAILLTGYLGGAMASHVRIGSPLFTHTLFGLYLGLMAWGGLWLRDRDLRTLIPVSPLPVQVHAQTDDHRALVYPEIHRQEPDMFILCHHRSGDRHRRRAHSRRDQAGSVSASSAKSPCGRRPTRSFR